MKGSDAWVSFNGFFRGKARCFDQQKKRTYENSTSSKQKQTRKTQYDGVAFVHQCPLQNARKNDGSNKQEIKFRVVDGPGLFWYHSHTGLSSVDGIFGPLIIRPPRTATETEGREAAAENALGDIEKEFLVLFGDWYHSTSGALGFTTGRSVFFQFRF